MYDPLIRRTRSETTRPFSSIIPCTILIKDARIAGTVPINRTGNIMNTCILLIILNYMMCDGERRYQHGHNIVTRYQPPT